MTLPKKKDAKGDASQAEERRKVVGRDEVAAWLKCSNSTASRYRREFPDMPVRTDPYSGVWEAWTDELDAWRNRHIDLFVSRQERLDAIGRGEPPMFPNGIRRW